MAWGTPWAQRQGPPRIDLLPRRIIEQRLVRRQRSGIGAAFLVLLALLGLWYALEDRQLTQAQREVDQERADASSLRLRRAELQPLADLESQIAAAEQLRTQVYQREIRFSGVLRDISAIVPGDVWLTKLTAGFTGAAAGSATGSSTTAAAPAATGDQAATATPGSPGAGSPVASITFTGAGLGHVDVGRFLRALASGPKNDGRPLYLNPYFTTSQKDDAGGQGTVTFSATVDLSPAAYSGRFQPKQPGTVTP
jgi:Tfp pilus assembly protein PilN